MEVDPAHGPEAEPTEAEGTEAARPAKAKKREPELPPFFELLQQVKAEDWQRGYRLYCYRTWPVIDRRDNEHFLAKLAEPVDEDRLLRDFGSGKYHLRLNDARGRTIAARSVSIHNPSFPPRVSPDEVVASDPRNELYFKVWMPKADGQPQHVAAAAPAAQPTAPATVVDAALRTAVEQLGGVTQTLLSQRQPVSPTVLQEAQRNVSEISAVIKELRALAAPQPKEDSGVSVIREVAGLLKELRPEPAPSPVAAPTTNAAVSFLSQAKEAAEAVKTIRDLLVPGSTEPHERRASREEGEEEGSAPGRRFLRRNPTAEVIEALGSAIGMAGGNLGMLMSGIPLLVRNVLGSFGGGAPATAPAVPLPAGGPAPPIAAPPPGSYPPGTIPRAVGPDNLGAATAPPSPEAGATPPPAGAPAAGAVPPGATLDPAEAQRQQLQDILRAFGPQILSVMAAGQDDPREAGAGFANSVSDLAGELQYRMFANLGVEGWMQALKASPLWPQLSQAPEVVQAFVEGFIAYGLPQGEGAPEPPKGKRKPTAKAVQ